MRHLHVSSKEEEVVLEVYSKYSGWDEILENVKQRVSALTGNWQKKQELINYYRHTSREAAIKIIRRIVSQNVQKVQQVGNQAQSRHSVRMSKTIKETRTRYSKKCLPE